MISRIATRLHHSLAVPLRRYASLHPTTRHFFRLFAGLMVLVVLAYSGKLDLVTLIHLRPGPNLWILFAVAFAALTGNSLRWVFLARASLRDLPFVDAAAFAVSSNFLAIISPAGTGADIARAVYLTKSGKASRAQAAGIAVLDRALGLYILLAVTTLVGWLCLPVSSVFLRLRAIFTVVSILLTLPGIACLYGPSRRRFIRWLGPRWQTQLSLLDSGISWNRVLIAGACAALGATANLLLPLVGLMALGRAPWTAQAAFASALTMLVNAIAPTPNGLGVGEAAASVLFTTTDAGASAMLLVRTVGILWLGILAFAEWTWSLRVKEPAGAGNG